MRSPKSFAVAVRTPDGGITVREEAWLSFSERFPILKKPVLRGATMLIESMYNGMQALSFSATTAFPEDEAAKKEAHKTQQAKEQGGLAAALPIVLSLAFAFGLFKGVLALFLLELGLVAGGRLQDLRRAGPRLLAFGLIAPPLLALAGGALGLALGLSVAGVATLATLAASASYIAAPTAMRIAVPQANPSLSIGLALGVTFPFNVLVGIPLYIELARRAAG